MIFSICLSEGHRGLSLNSVVFYFVGFLFLFLPLYIFQCIHSSLWKAGQVEVGQSIQKYAKKKIKYSVDIEQLDKLQARLSMYEQDPSVLLANVKSIASGKQPHSTGRSAGAL